jgi:hypothetical protein
MILADVRGIPPRDLMGYIQISLSERFAMSLFNVVCGVKVGERQFECECESEENAEKAGGRLAFGRQIGRKGEVMADGGSFRRELFLLPGGL